MTRTISAGALALVLLGPMAMGQQEAIPDAPRPRATLPVIPSVGPVNGAPRGDADNSSSPNTNGQQTAPPAAASKPPAAAEQTAPPPDQESIDKALKLYRLPGRVRVTVVQVPFTVKDSKGNLISGLTPHDVRILEDNVPQTLSAFLVDPLPLSVALVIDQSMAFNDMEKVNAALGAVQGAFAAYDEVSVFTYNNGPKKWTDFTGAQSERLPMVLQVSRSAGRDGLFAFTDGPMAQNVYKNGGADIYTDPNENNSNGARLSNNLNVPKEVHTLNDAIMAAAKELTRVGRGRRRVIYVISDGKEYGSKAKTKDVVAYLQAHEITVYATLVHDFPNLHIPFSGFILSKHLPFQMQDNILPKYANATGGLVDPELSSRGIINSLNRLAETARMQYTAFYTSNESVLDGKFHSIDVRILGRPGLTVIAKPGYYPTSDSAPATEDPTPPPSTRTGTPTGR